MERLIHIGTKVWEVWSLNLKHTPFYLGKATTDYVYNRNCCAGGRWADGHLGRFNYIVSPQVAGPPWWSFIMKQAFQEGTSLKLPEFEMVPMRVIK
jgi:hypothetical protein